MLVIGNGSNKLGTESGNDKLSSKGLMGYFRDSDLVQSVRRGVMHRLIHSGVLGRVNWSLLSLSIQ